MNRSLIKLAVYFAGGAICLALASCTKTAAYAPAYTPDKGIVYYDASFEIDPEGRAFRSQQKVTLTGSLAEGIRLTIFLDERLVIDELTLEDEGGEAIPIVRWRQVDTYTSVSLGGEIDLAKIVILTEEPIPADERLALQLSYHLPPEAFEEGLASNMYALYAGRRGLHAGGPESGAFPQAAGSLSAPFSITIKHPSAWRCALPGERTDETEQEGYTTTTYRADIAYDPSFSCARYTTMSTQAGDIPIELFIPGHLELSRQMPEAAARVLSLYREMFGEAPADSFRVVFPELDAEKAGGESNGNLVILGDITPFLAYDKDELAQDMFTHLMAHEGYHLWNSWAVNWEGTLAEWWVEGGANFMASWAKELLYGSASAARSRLHHLEGFIEGEAYLHKNPLARLDDTWFQDWALVYDYGALVWEQLRQKIGDEALTAGLHAFYEQYSGQSTGYEELIASLEQYTAVDVDAYLEQWTMSNAVIDLALQDVTVREVDGGYEVEAVVVVEGDLDGELFTALGYMTAETDEWQLIDLHFEGSGRYTVQFTSEALPLEMMVDPEYRVPQIELGNNGWTGD